MISLPRTLRVVAVVALSLAVGSCGVGEDESAEPVAASEMSTEPALATEETREDVDCTPEGLGEDEVTAFTSAHYVVDGQLGALCTGEEDSTLLGAWSDLVAITPPDQLNDLAVFAGFVHPQADELGDDAETTLAFVNAIDDEGTAFQMSVDLDEFDADRNQALLTLAHEFSHVFTTASTQMDRTEEAIAACDAYLTRDGCFYPDALITEWVELFWDEGRLDDLDPEVEPSLDAGADRCAADPSFLGEYAASDPEEDFAETFSAFVFAVEVDAPEVQEKLDWMADQPGLLEFRDRADDAGLTPLDNAFEGCG